MLDCSETAFAAVDRTPVRVPGEQVRLAIDRSERSKVGFLRRADELDLTRAQRVELRLLQSRPLQQVGEQLDHQLLIAGEERAADANALGAGGSIDLSADRRDRLGELDGVARTRAFLQQSGQQARHARLTGRVADCAATHDCGKRDQRHVMLFRQKHDRAVGKLHALEGWHLDAIASAEHAGGTEEEECCDERFHRPSPWPVGAAAPVSTPTVRLPGRSKSAASLRMSSAVTLSYARGASNNL